MTATAPLSARSSYAQKPRHSAIEYSSRAVCATGAKLRCAAPRCSAAWNAGTTGNEMMPQNAAMGHIEMKPADFIAKIKPGADACEASEGIPAGFTIAQAALESAWGSSSLSRAAFNLFGVKSDPSWTGQIITLPTREYLNGKWVTVNAKWRLYKDWAECLIDHAHFLKSNPRYSRALTIRDSRGFARAIAAAGYATDPRYADKLISIIDQHHLGDT